MDKVNLIQVLMAGKASARAGSGHSLGSAGRGAEGADLGAQGRAAGATDPKGTGSSNPHGGFKGNDDVVVAQWAPVFNPVITTPIPELKPVGPAPYPMEVLPHEITPASRPIQPVIPTLIPGKPAEPEKKGLQLTGIPILDVVRALFGLITNQVKADDKGSTLAPGPFAGESIPARGPERDFTDEERDQINEIGKKTGCHTCGTKNPGTKNGNFVPDHQPPSKLNPEDKSQQLYPHCIGCSRTQGGQVRGTQK